MRSIPHQLLVDEDGKIAFLQLGYGGSVLDRVVDELNRALAMNAEAVATQSAAPTQ